jgi:uncharacterized protein YuzE
MKSRYDAESDILYLLIREGEIKDTIEVSEDLFIEYDENDDPVGIELWRARTNVFGELIKYLNEIKGIKTSLKGAHKQKLKNVIPQ